MSSDSGFSDLGLSKELLRAVADLGFEEPSPIQRMAIPLVLEGRDLVGQAQTGTGKTAAFGLPLLQGLSMRSNKVQALVLCPTRELAVQVADEVSALARHLRGVVILPVYGGQSLERQISALRRGVQVVAGTPGRVLDHLERGTLKLDNLKMLVLDEADEMLDMGFREDIERVLEKAPEGCQKVCFSATMPKPILDIINRFMHEPEVVKIARSELTVPSIEQRYYEIRQHQKREALSLILDSQDIRKGIVFCSTKHGSDDLCTQLLARGYKADALHGNLSQAQRDRVMERFRKGNLDLLVATDVAARGLDVDDVDVVINYDIPNDVDNYVHRIGRTGRAGRKGRSITFVTPREHARLREIIRYTKADIERSELPSRREVSDIRTAKMLGELRSRIVAMQEDAAKSNKVDRGLVLLESLADEGFDPMVIALSLFKMLREKDVVPPEGPEIGKEPERRKERPAPARGAAVKPKGGKKRGVERLFFNLGSKANVSPRDLVGAITGETGLSGRLIGSIEIYERFSFVEVPKEYAQEVMQAMNSSNIRGMRVAVDIAKPQAGQER